LAITGSNLTGVDKVADHDKYNASLQSMFGKLATNERRALSLLIRLPAKGFVTTNYDRLLREQANLYDSNAFAPRAYPYLSASDLGGPKKPIYHIHGAIAQRGPVNIVLSKSEYKEAYGSRSLLPGLLKDLLSMQDILFVGCSLDEPAMKRLFKQVHDIIKRLSAGSQYAARRYILIEKRFQMIKDPVSNAALAHIPCFAPNWPDLPLSASVPLNSRVARVGGASRTSPCRTFLSSVA